MTKLRLALLAAALTTGVLAAPAPALAAKKPPNCAQRGSVTLEASRDARVYSVTDRSAVTRIYGCRNKKNRRTFLGVKDCQNDTAAQDFTLKGRYLGWVASSCGLTSGTHSIVVTNLDTGKRLHGAGAAQRPEGASSDGELSTAVSDYVMKANGSVAWIGLYSGESVQVRRLEPGSPQGGELVDQGLDIAKTSLALSDDGFYYRKGATPLFATLR